MLLLFHWNSVVTSSALLLSLYSLHWWFDQTFTYIMLYLSLCPSREMSAYISSSQPLYTRATQTAICPHFYPASRLFHCDWALLKHLLANSQRSKWILKKCLFPIQRTYICPFTALLISSILLCLFSRPLLSPLYKLFHDLRELTCHKTKKNSLLPHYYSVRRLSGSFFGRVKCICVVRVLLSSSKWSSNSCSAFNVHNYREHAEEDAALNLETGSKRVVFTTLA